MNELNLVCVCRWDRFCLIDSISCVDNDCHWGSLNKYLMWCKFCVANFIALQLLMLLPWCKNEIKRRTSICKCTSTHTHSSTLAHSTMDRNNVKCISDVNKNEHTLWNIYKFAPEPIYSVTLKIWSQVYGVAR